MSERGQAATPAAAKREAMKMNEMAKTAAAKKRSATRGRVRGGRPPLERAGEVEERILEAAHKVFLEHGFDGASIDLIAETSHSGKTTIYSRFPNKQALFVAAVAHRIALKIARAGSHKPSGATIEERLASIGVAMLRDGLTKEFVGLFRLAIAEARQFPDLVGDLMRMARQRGGETVAGLLAEAAERGEHGALPGNRQDRFSAAAQFFMDLILMPFLMRALSGESLKTLHAEIDAHVAQRIVFFLAVCRNGGLA